MNKRKRCRKLRRIKRKGLVLKTTKRRRRK